MFIAWLGCDWHDSIPSIWFASLKPENLYSLTVTSKCDWQLHVLSVRSPWLSRIWSLLCCLKWRKANIFQQKSIKTESQSFYLCQIKNCNRKAFKMKPKLLSRVKTLGAMFQGWKISVKLNLFELTWSHSWFFYSATCSVHKSFFFTSHFPSFLLPLGSIQNCLRQSSKAQDNANYLFKPSVISPCGCCSGVLDIWNNWGIYHGCGCGRSRLRIKVLFFVCMSSQPVEDRRRVRAILPYTKVPDTDEIR